MRMVTLFFGRILFVIIGIFITMHTLLFKDAFYEKSFFIIVLF
jgi:hypothetical protein